MTLNFIIYLIILTSAFVVSLTVWNRSPYVKWMCGLLGVSVLTEAIVNVMYHGMGLQTEYRIVYHVYILLKYYFMMMIFGFFVERSRVKNILRLSIPCFWGVCLYISFSTSFYTFPGYAHNILGIVVIAVSFYTLFSIKPKIGISLYSLPIFWFCVGWILYYSGIFTKNFFHQYLYEIGKEEVADLLNAIVNRGSNYLLYIFISIGLYCLRRESNKTPLSEKLKKYNLYSIDKKHFTKKNIKVNY